MTSFQAILEIKFFVHFLFQAYVWKMLNYSEAPVSVNIWTYKYGKDVWIS